MDLWFFQAARVLPKRLRDAYGAESTHSNSLLDLPSGSVSIEPATLDPTLAFVVKVARGLLSAGTPAHRVEEALARLATRLGFEASLFCTPTALILTLADALQVRTRVVRVEPGSTNLERLSDLYDLIDRVEKGKLSPEAASVRVDAILERESRYKYPHVVVAYALASGAVAIPLAGNARDVFWSLILGASMGVLYFIASRVEAFARLLPAICAFLVSLAGVLIASFGEPVQPSVLLLSALVVLLPGLTLTNALMELATAHLVAGTARLAAAAITFLQLGFGVALGRKIGTFVQAHRAPSIEAPLPAILQWVAPLFVAAGFTVLLRARPRDALWVLLSVSVALLGGRIGTRFLGPELGAFVGSLAVASLAHLVARFRDRPLNLILTPGILSLVPGSVGFLSIRSLLENDVVNAVETAFRMFLIAMAISSGVLVATVAVPPRKAL